MSFTSAVARRYLWMARKRAHTAFLSLISTLGLAVGVATLLISLALLSGLQGQIKTRLIASSPQLLVEPKGGNTIPDAASIVAAAKGLGFETVQPVISGIAYAANEDTRRGRPMRLRSHEREPRVDRRWIQPPDDAPAIFLARDFGGSIGLNLGDLITVVAPRTRLTPFGPVPVVRKFRIAGLLMPSGQERAFDASLAAADASSLFGTNGAPTSIEMFGNVEEAERSQAQLAARFPNVQVKTWKEINRPLFLALRLEKIVMFATISLIIFVAALNLISSLAMLIMEKRPQVGTLRTLGATEKDILSIFVKVGLLIGLTGTLLGNLFGIGVSWAANRYELIPLPREMYFIGHLPFHLDVSDVVGVNVIAIILSVIATWYPARVASRLDPIAAIREE